MRYMGLNELREAFLSYFESKGHLRLPSFPLIPQNDKSLLLINSGMAPMKKFFTGEVEPPRHRVCTCQKCIRTPDLERVGHTARHGTYFEMLGNFSFGDYFKDEAIPFAWEFLTKVLEIPADLLWPSIYKDDEEAFHIWKDVIGIPEERIVRLGKEDNFWEHGTGPCGPCSEIYFDRGEKYGCGSPDCRPGCDCDRYMEIWNNVFSQFDNDGHGNYTELKQKNIDTGMGLERLACVMQGVDNMFEVDTVRRILDKACEIAGKTYGENTRDDVSIRILTDHIRSASFMIADGVIPSNEGRGYVLRRILRRAARHGKLLGIDRPFLVELCEVMIGENEGAYPELREREAYVKKIISLEEERFNQTIDSGLAILSDLIAQQKKNGKTELAGESVFKLYDTFGFPIDLTREIAQENGLKVDQAGFDALMKEQKERARSARANVSGWSDAAKTALGHLPKTQFLGYEQDTAFAKVLAIFAEDEEVDALSEGEGTLILDRTVFYGEGGGQVGDTGVIVSEKGTFSVTDTKKTDGVFVHQITVENGAVSVGDTVSLHLDTVRRDAIRRNHSAVHLLQAALRVVLGDHVEQAGSFVDAERFRFDFKHYQAMTPDEIRRAEEIVNEKVLAGLPVTTLVTTPEEAKKQGAMALFGEKYGDRVRMVSMGDFSVELCGGTHLDNTAKAGLVKIQSESGVAAGIRRIEGITGKNVLKMIRETEARDVETAALLKTTPAQLSGKVQSMQKELKDARREMDLMRQNLADVVLQGLLKNAREQKGLALVFAECADQDLRTLGDRIREKKDNAVAVLYQIRDGIVLFQAVCGKDAVKAGAHAGNILKTLSAIVGGGGGGRPDCAQSGGRNPEKIPEARDAFWNMF